MEEMKDDKMKQGDFKENNISFFEVAHTPFVGLTSVYNDNDPDDKYDCVLFMLKASTDFISRAVIKNESALIEIEVKC